MKLLLALLAAVPLLAESRLELVRHSLTGTHCRYREYVDGIPSDVYTTRECSGAPFTAAATIIAPDTPLRIIDGRIARRVIVEERPLERYAYDYDVATGALIRVEPLFFHAKPARVFDPNPVVALNDPSLQDRNDSADAVPEQAYSLVELLDVIESGPLRGPFASLVDLQDPHIAPPDASSSLLFNRADDGFEDVNVYFHVDRTQRHLQSLGYVGARSVAAYSIEADAHSGAADNSVFLPKSGVFGEGTLHFGEGGTDDAEDADLIVHEYGHAILEWIAPGAFTGTFNSEQRALGEGFGDYWAYSAHVAQRLASGRDPFCFADWDARCWEDDASQRCSYQPGSDCLRRLDSTRTMADFDRSGGAGAEHRNGAIWSSALREIHQQLGRTITDTIVIESVFGVPPRPTFATLAQRMIEADRLLFSGSHVETICAAMTARGILATCDATRPRGELTLFQSGEHRLAIPESSSEAVTSTLTITDTRAIEKIFVRVDIEHPFRSDLRVELVAPDGTVIALLEPSGERGADVHATFGLTAQPVQPLATLHGRSAAGVWKLIVRDTRIRDAGTLLSWGLVLQLAGDAPLAARPRAERSQMIPVVTHVFGVGATAFASDVRMANPSTDDAVTATLIFTRSTEDGAVSFSAFDVQLAPGQTVAFDDVVASAFHTFGSGTLEVLGDVVVMSRTYAITETGTLGQQVPPVADSTAMNDVPLALAPLPEERSRYNIGIAELAGHAGVVMIGERRIEILPFSHVQFPADSSFAIVRVVSGDARVGAYVSQVNEHDDAMFIPAERLPTTTRDLVAPAISAGRWRSDLWFRTANATRIFPDVLRTVIGRGPTAQLYMRTERNELAGTRIDAGTTDQFVPLLGPPADGEQHLVFIESAAPYRTNIGIVAYSTLETSAEVVVYDAGGAEVQRTILHTENGVAQTAVLPRIASGRAVVRFLGANGHGYASVIDNRTGDATYVQAK